MNIFSHNLLDDLWLGTPESLETFMELKETFKGLKRPQKVTNQQLSVAKEFEVDPDLPGIPLLTKMGSTAMISISGSMSKSVSLLDMLFGDNVTSYTSIRSAVDIAARDDSIDQVIFHIDSPGGSLGGLHSTGKDIARLSQVKDTVAFVDNQATSAAYWLAASTNKIVATEMAQLGSIGVITVMQDISRQAENEGIKFIPIYAGKNKADGFPGTAFTDEEIARIQARIDKTYNFFLTHVAESRNLSISSADKWADAQVFYAGEAKVVGLVDEIADFVDIAGGRSTANSHDRGIRAMTISEEKLALISAGASPETVLTPEELKAYTDEVSAQNQAADDENLEDNTNEVKASDENLEGAGDLDQGGNQGQNYDLALQLGRAEAKIEYLTQALEEVKSSIDLKDEQVQGLKRVAQAAVKNLQVALQEPRETVDSPAEIVSQYDKLRERLSSIMPKERVSSDKLETKEMDMRPKMGKNIPDPLRPE